MLYNWLPFVLAIILSAGTSRIVFADDSNQNEINRELSEIRETLSKAVERLHRLEEKWGEGKAGTQSANVTDDDIAWRKFGLRLEDIDEEVFETTYKGQSYRGGVLVAEVRPESSAAAAGVRKNDVLRGLNGFAVRNVTDIRPISAKEPASKEAKDKFSIIRNGKMMIAGTK